MAQLRLQPPEEFNFRNPDDWLRWKRRFEVSGLAVETAMKQVSTFLCSLGEESESVLTSMNATADDRKEYTQVIEKFNAFFKTRKNVIFERARFNRRNHLTGETAEQYIMTLYTLAEPCEHGNLKDEMIRDRLVVGIRDHALSVRLQLDADLTLEKAKKSVRQREAVQEQQLVLKGASEPSNVPSSLKVLHSRKGYPPGGQHGSHSSNRCGEGRLRPKTSSAQGPQKQCTRCGKGQHARDKCPAKDATCHCCQRKGHYSALCYSKTVSAVSETTTLDTAFLDTVESNNATAWFTQIQLGDQETLFKLDTGAEVTAISPQAYQQLGKPQLLTSDKALYGPSKQSLQVLGKFTANLTHQGTSSAQQVFVVTGLKTNLLGLPAITAVNLAARVESTSSTPTDMREKFSGVFKELGNLGEEYEIRLKPDTKPYCLFTPHHVPLPLRTRVTEELSRMSAVLSGLDGVLCQMDDVLVFGKDRAQHDGRVTAALQRIESAGVTLNPEKCELGKTSLKFLGHLINESGIRADPAKTSSIREMRRPVNVSELRRFMGMVNQLRKFTPNFTELTQPRRELLGKKRVQLWGLSQDQAFARVKAELAQPTTLSLYDTVTSTKVSVDASSYGLGAVLLQEVDCLETNCIYLTLNDGDRTPLRPNRERGSGRHMGL